MSRQEGRSHRRGSPEGIAAGGAPRAAPPLVTAAPLLLCGCALPLLLLLCGCALPLQQRTSPPPRTGIVGRVVLSGGPAPGTTRPYPASEVKVSDAAGRVVALTRPGPDGSYRIALAPGRYRVQAVPTAGNPWFAPRTVAVRSGRYSVVDIQAFVP